MLVNKNMKMADLVHYNYQIVPLLNRFDIQLGFGDKDIEEVCTDQHINIDFFLDIMNTFCDKHYFPESHFMSFSMKIIVGYLLKSHQYYRRYKIPSIEKMINQLKWDEESDENQRMLLKKFFVQYEKEVNIHIDEEETLIYPYAIKLENKYNSKNIQQKDIEEIDQNKVQRYAKQHGNLEYKLSDFKNIIIKYLNPPLDMMLYNNILAGIFSLESDLNSHAIFENKILIPKIEAYEKKILSDYKSKKN